MIELTKKTEDGRFTVRITSSFPQEAILMDQDVARSLKQLSDVLTDAAGIAIRLAVEVLERGSLRTTR